MDQGSIFAKILEFQEVSLACMELPAFVLERWTVSSNGGEKHEQSEQQKEYLFSNGKCTSLKS